MTKNFFDQFDTPHVEPPVDKPEYINPSSPETPDFSGHARAIAEANRRPLIRQFGEDIYRDTLRDEPDYADPSDLYPEALTRKDQLQPADTFTGIGVETAKRSFGANTENLGRNLQLQADRQTPTIERSEILDTPLRMGTTRYGSAGGFSKLDETLRQGQRDIGAGMEQYGKDLAKSARPSVVPKIENIDSIKKFGIWAYESAVEMAVSGGMILGTGAAGTAVGGPGVGAAAAIGLGMGMATGEAVGTLERERDSVMMQAGQAKALGLDAAAENLARIAAEMTPEKQRVVLNAIGTINGMLDSVVPLTLGKLPGGGAVRDELGRYVVSAIGLRIAAGMGQEGLTETLQESVQVLGMAKAKGAEAAQDYLRELNDKKSDILNAGAKGMIGGGAFSSAGVARDLASGSREKKPEAGIFDQPGMEEPAPQQVAALPPEQAPQPTVPDYSVPLPTESAPNPEIEQAVEIWRQAQAGVQETIAEPVADAANETATLAEEQAAPPVIEAVDAIVAELPPETQAQVAPIVEAVREAVPEATQAVGEQAAAIPQEIITQLEQLGIAQAKTEQQVREIMAQRLDPSKRLQEFIAKGGSLTGAPEAITRGAGLNTSAELATALRSGISQGALRQTLTGRIVPTQPVQPKTAEGVKATISDLARQMAPILPRGTVVRSFKELADLPQAYRGSVAQGDGKVVSRATQAPVDAFADGDALFIAEYATNPAGRIAHEGVHALKNAGLISDKEIALLAERARKVGAFSKTREAAYVRDYKQRFTDWQTRIDEEAAAHLIEARVNGEDFGRQINGIIDRILEFVRRLGNALRGMGFQTTDDVVNAMLSGEMARRQAVQQWMRENDVSAMAVRPEAMMAMSDRETGQSMRRDLDALGYYSQALEAARSLKQAKGTPEQMLAQLKSAGVKQAEIEATGLPAFLDGKKSITRDEIVSHLEANRVGMREVLYPELRPGTSVLSAEQLAARQGVSPDSLPLKFYAIDADGSPLGGGNTYDQAAYLISAKRTKWSSYSLDPSNPSYRETVLHLPVANADELARKMWGRGYDWLDEHQGNLVDQAAGTFQSGHFPEPNIVGHMMTSMTKHEGQPVYTVDQIQSDWGQKLRDGGVRDEAKVADLKRQLADEKAKFFAAIREKFPGRDALDIPEPALNKAGISSAEWDRLQAEVRTAESAASGHPLVNTTDQWTTTTLRRALRQAAEADAAYIAIPSGDTVLSYNPGDTGGMRGFYGATRVRDAQKVADLERQMLEAKDRYEELAAQFNPKSDPQQRARSAKVEYDRIKDEWAKESEAWSDKFIDGIVPKNLRKLLEKLDKDSAKPIKTDELETPSGMKGKGFTLFPLTDKVKAEVTQRGQAMFAFAGEKAKTADLSALARAKQMEAEGTDRTKIWTDTGWFKGVDGKWRFEIDDSKSDFDMTGAMDDGWQPNERWPLDHLMSHKALYSAYPDMAAKSISYRDFPEGYDDAAAAVSRKGDAITFNSRYRDFKKEKEMRSFALHEIQHLNQRGEGFAKGGGARDFTPDELAAERVRLQAIQDSKPNVSDWSSFDASAAVSDMSDAMVANSLYRRLAGEVEARAVEKRINLTPEQRQARPPWLDYDVPEDQQIVRFADGSSPSGTMFAMADPDAPLTGPMRVYHGTSAPQQFTKFNRPPWMTESPEIASAAAYFETPPVIRQYVPENLHFPPGRVFPLDINPQNPFVVRPNESIEQAFERYGYGGQKTSDPHGEAAAHGHDFFIYDGTTGDFGLKKVHRQIVPLLPDSVKSATTGEAMFAMADETQPPEVKSLQSIVGDLARDLGLVMRQGLTKTAKGKAAARAGLSSVYDPETGILRVVSVSDIQAVAGATAPVIRHKFGAKLDRLIVENGRELVNWLTPAIRAGELSERQTALRDAVMAEIEHQRVLAEPSTNVLQNTRDEKLAADARFRAARDASQRALQRLASDIGTEQAARLRSAVIGRLDLTEQVGMKPVSADLIAREVQDAYAEDLTPKPPSPVAVEDAEQGWRDFMRNFVSNPTNAAAKYPRFTRAFERFLEAEDPILLAKLESAQEAIDAYYKADPTRFVDAIVHDPVKETRWEKFADDRERWGLKGALGMRLSSWYRSTFDEQHPFFLATWEMLNEIYRTTGQRMDLPTALNPYKLLRLAPHSHAWATRDMEMGVRDYTTNDHAGPGLIPALTTALGPNRRTARDTGPGSAYRAFSSYLVARYAAIEWQRHMEGKKERPPTVMPPRSGSPASAVAYFNEARAKLEAEHPSFAQAADQIYDYQQQLLKLQRDAGLIKPETYDILIQDREYVPFYRQFDADENVPSRALGSGAGGVLKRKRGSDRNVIDPIASIAQKTFETRSIIALNDVKRNLLRLAEAAGPGGGVIAERIDRTRLKEIGIDVDKVISTAADDLDLDGSDLPAQMAMAHQVLGNDAVATYYTQKNIPSPGRPPIVFFFNNGEVEALQLGNGSRGHQLAAQMLDNLNTFGKLHNDAMSSLLMIARAPAQITRVGITTHPEFAAANIVRDALMAFQYDRRAIPMLTQIKGAIDVMRGAEYVQRFYANAGMMGGEATAALDKLRMDRDIRALVQRGYKFRLFDSLPNALDRISELFEVRNWKDRAVGATVGAITGAAIGGPVGAGIGAVTGGMIGGSTIVKIGEVSETATRAQLFELAYQRGLKNGLDEAAAAQEAAFWSHEYTDYSRRGSKMEAFAAIVPFLNANLQGNDVYVRRLLGKGDQSWTPGLMYPLYRLGLLDITKLSPKEQEQLGDSAWTWAMTIFGLGSISLAVSMLWDDDERIKDIDDRVKSSHWLIPVGKEIYRIPKPFQTTWFSQIIERWMTEGRHNNPRWFEHYLEDLWNTWKPPVVPAIAEVGATMAGVDLNNGGRQVIPDYIKRMNPDRTKQADAYTSEFAKWAGPKLDTAPMLVDHMITKFGATWGRTALSLNVPGTPWYNENKPIKGPEEEFIARRFMWKAGRGSEAGQAMRQIMGAEEPLDLLAKRIAQPYSNLKKAADNYRDLIEKPVPDHAGAIDYLATLTPYERGYALMEGTLRGQQDAKLRLLHPMNRASKMATELIKMEKEIVGGELLSGRKGKDLKQLPMSPEEKTATRDILTQLRMMETHNALVITEETGWKGRMLFKTDDVMAELKAAAPKAHKELLARFTKAGILSFDGVAKVWPDVRARLEDPRMMERARRNRMAGASAQFSGLYERARATRPGSYQPQAEPAEAQP